MHTSEPNRKPILVFRLIHLDPALTMAMAFLARRCEARMGLALAVHVKGFGFWLRCGEQTLKFGAPEPPPLSPKLFAIAVPFAVIALAPVQRGEVASLEGIATLSVLFVSDLVWTYALTLGTPCSITCVVERRRAIIRRPNTNRLVPNER